MYTQLVGAVLRQKCQGAAMWEGLAAAKKLAGATVELYEALRKKFSVDEQRHYLFTPRDLTQWIVGLARYDLNEGGTSVLDMWAAEGSQQLRARLVSAQHHAKFDALVGATLKGHFDYTQDDKQTGALYSALMMGAADRAGAAPDRALTLKRASAAEVEKVVAVGLKAYEREVKELGLLLFPEALRHIVAMDRVLSRPGGNLLLVGASGVGRRSLLSLACHLHGLELVSPSMVRDYSLRSFCAELKVALPKAGVTGTPTCLLLEDHMLRDTPVIEAVNSLLAAGEIPGLFEPQELEPMLAPLKEEFGQQGFKYRTLFDFFVARVQKFLHLALSMDPSSPTFLLRCESNPALYTRCTMLWMGQLGADSMEVLPRAVFHGLDDEQLAQQASAIMAQLWRNYGAIMAQFGAIPLTPDLSPPRAGAAAARQADGFGAQLAGARDGRPQRDGGDAADVPRIPQVLARPLLVAAGQAVRAGRAPQRRAVEAARGDGRGRQAEQDGERAARDVDREAGGGGPRDGEHPEGDGGGRVEPVGGGDAAEEARDRGGEDGRPQEAVT